MTAFKRAILFAHRWLGFITGSVVFVISVTACIYTFQDEIQDALLPYRKVNPLQRPMLPPSRLERIAWQQYPDGVISLINYYTSNRSVQVRITARSKLHSIYIDPYTGRILYDDQDFKHNFFNTIKQIHLYCFFPPKAGKVVVGVSTAVYLILLVSGMVLWWPRRKTDRKRCFTIKWKGRTKRLNYDLHNILGFYAFVISFILGFSGLAISYDWLSHAIYAGVNGGQAYPQELKKFTSADWNTAGTAPPIDIAYDQVRRSSPQAQMMLILPGTKKESTMNFIAYPKTLHFSYSDNYAFDRYSARLLKYLPYTRKSAGLRLLGMDYDIHVGQIGGLAGKILAFLASLISASLPITGLILYLGKRSKARQKITSKKPINRHRLTISKT
jgi:uncharacterized iron-regulated membrane protein